MDRQTYIRTCRAASLQLKRMIVKMSIFYSPCNGHILTVVSKKRVEDTIADAYLKNRMNDYMKYKKMFPSEKISALENMYYDYKGEVKILYLYQVNYF